jgi:hypothetical protein
MLDCKSIDNRGRHNMHCKNLQSLMRTLAIAAVVALFITTGWAYQEDGPSRNLGQTIFVYGDPAADRDGDGLRDSLEFELANSLKPKLIFDRDEKARGPAEPKVLFQVRPEGCIGNGCVAPWKVWIAYSFLFAEDGGYGPEALCAKDAHKGDNDRLRILTESRDGQNWKVVQILNAANTQFVWPGTKVEWEDGHVRIYMSAHKHHQYFDTTYNHKTSVYSAGSLNNVGIGCDEDVAGDGDRVTPSLVSAYSDRRYNNVGEPDSHSCSYFVDDLAPFGFSGQYAWGGEFYDTGTAMKDVWLYQTFSFGRLFCTYTPPGVPRTLKRATISLLTVKRLDGSSGAPTNSFSFVLVANNQRHQVSAAIGNIGVGPTIIMKKNSAVVDGLPECERLQLRIEAFNANELIAKFGNTFDGDTNFGSGERTATLTSRAEDSLPVREKKLFEITYRITVLTVREHAPSIPR